ncbi:MAG: hypothetical protein HFJ79_06170 [Clostridiales bacterium]|jgi:acyl carrier protein|nr:hypothetical protein [Clostridiales bacterium]
MLIDKILACLRSLGVYADHQDVDAPLDSLIQDSITYVSFIVELERTLDIQLPDEFIQSSSFGSLSILEKAISPLLQKETV